MLTVGLEPSEFDGVGNDLDEHLEQPGWIQSTPSSQYESSTTNRISAPVALASPSNILAKRLATDSGSKSTSAITRSPESSFEIVRM